MPLSPRIDRRTARGVALIEAIVAMVVLAVGLLGLVVSQNRLLVDSRANVQRATAVGLTEDLANRMLANREQALTGAYDRAWADAVPAAVSCGGVSAPCTAPQRAAVDLRAWLAELQRALPGATATVFRATGDRRQIGIAISWAPNEAVSADADRTAVLTALNTGITGTDCPAQRLCHLTYVQP